MLSLVCSHGSGSSALLLVQGSTLLSSSLVFSLLVMWKNIMTPPSTPFRMVKPPYSGAF